MILVINYCHSAEALPNVREPSPNTMILHTGAFFKKQMPIGGNDRQAIIYK